MTAPPTILGHDRVVERLTSAVRHAKLHHAYLFEGPTGVGKTTVALHIARMANCTGAPLGEGPCGSCPTCVQIAAGTHPDVIRLAPREDRASQTIAVEDVREVVRRAGYRRFNSRRRFILVEPAEALELASNALLKTLEEPPEGTVFLLLASNATALLPTIRSRCQRVRFGAVPVDRIEAWLYLDAVAQRKQQPVIEQA